MTQSLSYSQATPSPHAIACRVDLYPSIGCHERRDANDCGKKAILASWISDARAVEDAPLLRRLDSRAVVSLDEIRRVLVSLDEPSVGGRETQSDRLLRFQRRRGVVTKWLRRISSSNRSYDDDDDPPPAPAGLGKAFRPTFVAAHGQATWKPDLTVPGRRARVAVSA
jgi:hypothetical protein